MTAGGRPGRGRRALIVVLALAWLVVSAAAGAVLGWASESRGWLWTALAAAPGLAVAVLAWGGSRRGPVVVAAAAALAVGVLTWTASPPTLDRVEEVAADVPVPAGWTPDGTLRSSGNTWCFGNCPTAYRYFAVEGGLDDDTLDQAIASFADAGWEVGERTDDVVVFYDGRWRARVAATTSDFDAHDAIVTVTG